MYVIILLRSMQFCTYIFFFFQAEDGIRDVAVTGVQTCALPILLPERARDAEVLLQIANVAEEEGTFVNRDGRVQRYFQAKPAPGMARPAWWVFAELVATLQGGGHVATAADAFDRLAASIEAFRGLSYPQLGFAGPR